MNDFQKVIKYIAIAFGFYLALQIIVAIVIGTTALLGAVTGWKNFSSNEKVEIVNITKQYEDVQELKIELALSDLTIQQGDEWKVEVANMPKGFEEKQSGKRLILTDENIEHKLFQNLEVTPKVVVTIPKGIELNQVKIETGIGSTNIQGMNCNGFELNQGVGNVKIENITCEKMNVKGGAGTFELVNVNSQSLHLEAGVGKTVVKGNLQGDSRIEAGIGAMKLELIGAKENYTIKPQTGIGAIYIDRTKVEGNASYGEGDNVVRIEGGMGKVDISFVKD